MRSIIRKIASVAILCFITGYPALQLSAQNPTMDARWKIITNDGSTLRLQLGIRTNTSGLKLGPATFIFAFDSSGLRFANNATTATKNVDYFWDPAFDPDYTDYTQSGTKVVQNTKDTISIILDFSSGSGAPVSDSAGYTPVIDLVWTITNSSANTTLSWLMNESAYPMMDDVFDDQIATNFYEGSFSGLNIGALPVNLTDFSAQMSHGRAILQWTTAAESNNHYFTVERSADAVSFYPLLRINGLGFSTQPNIYTAYDNAPLEGKSYYRLKQTDFNGAEKTFPMVPLTNMNTIDGLNLSGYFAKAGDIRISYQSISMNKSHIVLSDVSGKILINTFSPAVMGMQKDVLYCKAPLHPGLYFLSLSKDGETSVIKMLKP